MIVVRSFHDIHNAFIYHVWLGHILVGVDSFKIKNIQNILIAVSNFDKYWLLLRFSLRLWLTDSTHDNKNMEIIWLLLRLYTSKGVAKYR